MNILLITGESGSGKSTLAKSIIENKAFEKINKLAFAFGDYLKEYTAQIMGLKLEDLHNENKEKYRDFIKITADSTKAKKLTFFTDETIRREFDLYRPRDLYVCQDWRFDYELNCLQKAFPNARIRTTRLLKGFKSKGDHNSERTLDNHIMDFTIDNTSLSKEQTASEVIKRMEIWFPGLFN